MTGLPVDAAFIGSCTNSRLSDLRRAAALLRGRKVAPGAKALCVPGSTDVRARAEAEGNDRAFLDAGFEWRAAGGSEERRVGKVCDSKCISRWSTYHKKKK